jgi:hypothetical protein
VNQPSGEVSGTNYLAMSSRSILKLVWEKVSLSQEWLEGRLLTPTEIGQRNDVIDVLYHLHHSASLKTMLTRIGGRVMTPENSRRCLFVTDDKLIDDLVAEGSIDHIIRQAIHLGMEPLQAIQMATLNAAECFGLSQLGAIAPGYQADFFLTNDLSTLPINTVFSNGKIVVENAQIQEQVEKLTNDLPQDMQ